MAVHGVVDSLVTSVVIPHQPRIEGWRSFFVHLGREVGSCLAYPSLRLGVGTMGTTTAIHFPAFWYTFRWNRSVRRLTTRSMKSSPSR